MASGAWQQLGEDLRARCAEELNIGTLESLADAGGDLVDHSAKGNFRNLGKRFGKQTPQVAAAIAAADAAELAASLAATGTATVDVDGSKVEVGPDDVIISERPREGWSVVNEQGETVALDLELDDELRRPVSPARRSGSIQEARKSSGLDVSDRITLSWSASGPMADALRAHDALIADEVLATSISESDGASDFTDEELGFGFALAKV